MAILIAAVIYTWMLGIAYGIVPLLFILMIPFTDPQPIFREMAAPMKRV